jgi:hypothetical protein
MNMDELEKLTLLAIFQDLNVDIVARNESTLLVFVSTVGSHDRKRKKINDFFRFRFCC